MSFNRTDKIGAWTNVGLAIVLVAIANIVIFSLNLGASDPAYLSLSFAPPGWLVAMVWFCIYIMWGLTRWFVIKDGGDKGLEISWWLIFLIIDGLFFPIRTRNFDINGSIFESLISTVFIVFVAWRVSKVSKTGMYLMIPSICWTIFANILVWASLANRAK
jgi:tryptophan-rich sensory protein